MIFQGLIDRGTKLVNRVKLAFFPTRPEFAPETNLPVVPCSCGHEVASYALDWRTGKTHCLACLPDPWPAPEPERTDADTANA